ncbi:hypothetical protein [Streptomyces sp. PR69]|uniref:hypothetical protein n=1 Tax=Streptomyces sp. PR69 TaxID=2984950 RepID=UPI0022644E69|nr:hypothetical protein [Streptomyces sp. PR69]
MRQDERAPRPPAVLRERGRSRAAARTAGVVVTIVRTTSEVPVSGAARAPL